MNTAYIQSIFLLHSFCDLRSPVDGASTNDNLSRPLQYPAVSRCGGICRVGVHYDLSKTADHHILHLQQPLLHHALLHAKCRMLNNHTMRLVRPLIITFSESILIRFSFLFFFYHCYIIYYFMQQPEDGRSQ